MALILVVAGSPFALGDGEETGPREEAVRATIVRATTSTRPRICDEVFSDRWLSANFASEAQSAISRCREVTREESRKADTVDVSAISIDGSRATATVRVTGGNLGRARLELALVEAEGWRLDELTDIDVDRVRYLAAQRQAVKERAVHEDAAPLLRCMLDYAKRDASAAQIEESLQAGNEEFYAGSFPGCASEFRLMLFSPATIGAGGGYSVPESRCISRRASGSIDDDELGVLFSAFLRDEPAQDILAEERDTAIARCVGGA